MIGLGWVGTGLTRDSPVSFFSPEQLKIMNEAAATDDEDSDLKYMLGTLVQFL